MGDFSHALNQQTGGVISRWFYLVPENLTSCSLRKKFTETSGQTIPALSLIHTQVTYSN